MDVTAIEVLSNYERVYMHGATVSALVNFLDASVPWVWILGHRPNPYIEWWNTSVAVNSHGASFTGAIRNACFDMQLPTTEFVARAQEFDEHGLELIQSNGRMPDTLCLERIPELDLRRVLLQNGATLRIWLPHAIETAIVESYSPGYLAKVLHK